MAENEKICSNCGGTRNPKDFSWYCGYWYFTSELGRDNKEIIPESCVNRCLKCAKERIKEIKDQLGKCHRCKKELTKPYFEKNTNEYVDGSWKYEQICKPCMEKAIEQKEIWDASTVGDWSISGSAGIISNCEHCGVFMPKIRQHEKKDGKVVKLKHNCKTNDEEIKKLQKGKPNDNNDNRERERERERESKFPNFELGLLN